jgi:hypothetical protein
VVVLMLVTYLAAARPDIQGPEAATDEGRRRVSSPLNPLAGQLELDAE